MLFSSVCGCGIDMIPFAQIHLCETISCLISDVISSQNLISHLAYKLLPIPGKFSNEKTSFNHDFLIDRKYLILGFTLPNLNSRNMKDFWEEQSLKKVEFIHSLVIFQKTKLFQKKRVKRNFEIENYFNELKKFFNCIEICWNMPMDSYLKILKKCFYIGYIYSNVSKGKSYIESKYNSKDIFWEIF